MERKVVIAGAVRIPFARAYTAYADRDNLAMLTAVFKSLGSRSFHN